MDALTGHCLCRTVAFEISAAPLRVLYCHCESCRRATSAPVAAFLIVQRAGFRYTRGMPRHYASSPGVRRSFCEACGTPLAYETEQRPDQIDLYVCSLSDPSVISPHQHVFAEEQLPWFEVLDNLPRHARSPGDGGAIWQGPRTRTG